MSERGSGGPEGPVTTAATFCATLVDEWIRHGVDRAFVAPGSRSTPLALALAARPEMAIEVFHDERPAGFAALGSALASGRPAVALCSSGTAVAHFHAAVIEADLSGVPLIVCSADRPPELWSVGAPQTIDQTHLFGRAVRWFAQPGVPDETVVGSWRSWASRAVAEASGWSGRPGPVHLDLSFRDPLTGVPGPLPDGRPDGRGWHETVPSQLRATTVPGGSGAERLSGWSTRRGVLIAGAGIQDPGAVVTLADAIDWPLIADHRSGCRSDDAISYGDALLRVEAFVESHRPEVIVRLGDSLASKVLGQWLATSAQTGEPPSAGVEIALGAGAGRWLDPERITGLVLPEAEVLAALSTGVGRTDDGWRASWQAADALVGATLDDLAASLPGDPLSSLDPFIVRAAVAAAPADGAIVAASSMAVREVEWFAGPRTDIDVFANRGANGIDGTIATAIGVATTGRPTLCILGDVAFLHDSTALVSLARRELDLTILVLDNDGGGIFGFLPQHDQVPPETFEQLFGTPHGTDLGALARAHDLPVERWSGSLPPISGPLVLLARTDRAERLEVQRLLDHTVSERLTRWAGARRGWLA